MASNSKFAVAIHTAGMLAYGDYVPMTSEHIAQSVRTNPVVVRRVIGLLTKRGLVTVRKGQCGGATLTRPPEDITLDEIYVAVQPGPLLQAPLAGSKHQCPIGRHIGPVLDKIFLKAELGLMECLRQVTLADVIRTVRDEASAGWKQDMQAQKKGK